MSVNQQTPLSPVAAIRLWECRACGQRLLQPWLPCDCPGLHGERYLVTPLGLVPATPADLRRPEVSQEAA